MTTSISRLTLSQVECPLQEAALKWWSSRSGVAELDNSEYLELAPHLQIALDAGKAGAPCFFYVGHRSLTAELLGNNFNASFHAGLWWDDGGYATAVSQSYAEVSSSKLPVLERIKAYIKLPASLDPRPRAFLDYVRLCLPTHLEDGTSTFSVVSTGSLAFGRPTKSDSPYLRGGNA